MWVARVQLSGNRDQKRKAEGTKAAGRKKSFSAIYIGIDIGFIQDEIGKQWVKETRELSAMLVGLIKLKRNKK